MDNIKDLIEAKRNIILKGFDPMMSGGFVQLPRTVLLNKELTAGAKITYSMLLHYAWQKDFCFPGQETMAKELGSSGRGVRKQLNQLVKIGFVSVKRRGQGKTNIYTLHAKPKKKQS